MTTRRHYQLATLLILPLALWGATATLSAGQRQRPRTMPLSQAELFFELNDTDGDLGIHAAIDGGTWTSLEVEGPDGRKLLSVVSKSRLRMQGLTQLAFESAEPPFEELDPADFFGRFPEGVYEIEALAQGGGELEGAANLSHVLAAAPDNITLSGVPAVESCDADPLPEVSAPVVIRWDPVTQSHPEIGKTGPVVISRYQLFVEGAGRKLGVDLPPSVTGFEVPASVTDGADQFKFEIIARTSTGNNTAIESCFRLR